jgi:hypothetical protein
LLSSQASECRPRQAVRLGRAHNPDALQRARQNVTESRLIVNWAWPRNSAALKEAVATRTRRPSTRPSDSRWSSPFRHPCSCRQTAQPRAACSRLAAMPRRPPEEGPSSTAGGGAAQPG